MFAIAFDINTECLKDDKVYPWAYNNAYSEIQTILYESGFTRTQWSVYLTWKDWNITNVYKAIDSLKKIDWFVECVRDIRAFEVQNWSDFTKIVKGE